MGILRSLRAGSALLLFITTSLVLACSPQVEKDSAREAGFPTLTGDYLGQPLPGDTPEVFAPGIITTGMYTWAHLPKAAGETLGCIFMGVVFGATALATGSILAPVLVHIAIAVSTERFTIRHHPEMTFVRAS